MRHRAPVLRSSRLRLAAVAAVSALALSACATGPTPEQMHARDWEMTTRSDWPAAYQNYLRIWPAGAYADIARERIVELNAADLSAFADAKRVDTELAYVDYLDRYPWSQNVPEAAALRDLRAAPRLAAEERADFEAASTARSIDQWEAFLARWPGGANAEAARSRLDALWKTDQGAFVMARRTGSPFEIDEFIRTHPRSTYVADARRELEHLRLADNEAWRVALAQDSTAGYDRYLSQNPYGEWRREAQAAIQTLRDRDFAAWQHARQLDTIWAYESYRNSYPWGFWHDDAWLRIDWLNRSHYGGGYYNDRNRGGRGYDGRGGGRSQPPPSSSPPATGRPDGGSRPNRPPSSPPPPPAASSPPPSLGGAAGRPEDGVKLDD